MILFNTFGYEMSGANGKRVRHRTQDLLTARHPTVSTEIYRDVFKENIN